MAHLRKQVDAAHCIALLLTPLLRLLLPPRGRHRAAAYSIATPAPTATTAHTETRAHHEAPHRTHLPGEDSPLVRPYVLTPDEWRRKKRRQRHCRRALWLAVHGIDIGPRRIHGVEVAA
ncbi:hypothetical protein [Streptomyces sp. NBC_01615]|uniref:hypothetical protein n=1 Tax=Streptomyces sp. NBC_01615 TaxID=2975898 RepID=UPI003869EAEF